MMKAERPSKGDVHHRPQLYAGYNGKISNASLRLGASQLVAAADSGYQRQISSAFSRLSRHGAP
jgi:hypothetical protein